MTFDLTRRAVWMSMLLSIWLLGLAPADAAAQVRDAAPPAGTGAGSISGVVVRADDERQPIRGALVAAIGVASGTTRMTKTGDDGTFSITGLPADRYNVGATKPPFLPAMAGAKRAARPGSAVVIAAGQSVTNVKIRTYPGAAITGVIRDPTGDPAARVDVALMRWRMRNGERVLATPLVTSTVETDDRGRYRFFGLAPGEYVVVAMRSGAMAPHVLSQFDVDAALSSDTAGIRQVPNAYVPIYYPGTMRSADAGAVTVGLGEERAGIDFQLESAKPARLRVAVATADGQPFSNATVVAGTFPDSVATQENSSGIRAGGPPWVDFGNLRPDMLVVTAVATVNGNRYSAATTVEVTSGNDHTVSLVMRAAATVAGRIVLDGAGGTAPAVEQHRVGLRGLTGTPRGEFQPTATPADAAGVFSLTGVIAGRYLINGTGPGGWALKSVVVDGRDVTDRAIDVNADLPPKQIVVTYTDRWQQVSGRLQLATGAPVNDYTIVVIPADPSLWPFGTRRILTARPGTNGEFVFGGPGASTLPAGDYLLAAVTDIESDDLADPKFLAALAQNAIALTLKPGERKVQNLAVGAGGSRGSAGSGGSGDGGVFHRFGALGDGGRR